MLRNGFLMMFSAVSVAWLGRCGVTWVLWDRFIFLNWVIVLRLESPRTVLLSCGGTAEDVVLYGYLTVTGFWFDVGTGFRVVCFGSTISISTVSISISVSVQFSAA